MSKIAVWIASQKTSALQSRQDKIGLEDGCLVENPYRTPVIAVLQSLQYVGHSAITHMKAVLHAV